MTKLKAHFDGKVLVPDEPVDLPTGCTLEIQVQALASSTNPASQSLLRLVELARQNPVGDQTPSDLAEQHDHYLYGAPKRQ